MCACVHTCCNRQGQERCEFCSLPQKHAEPEATGNTTPNNNKVPLLPPTAFPRWALGLRDPTGHVPPPRGGSGSQARAPQVREGRGWGSLSHSLTPGTSPEPPALREG